MRWRIEPEPGKFFCSFAFKAGSGEPYPAHPFELHLGLELAGCDGKIGKKAPPAFVQMDEPALDRNICGFLKRPVRVTAFGHDRGPDFPAGISCTGRCSSAIRLLFCFSVSG